MNRLLIVPLAAIVLLSGCEKMNPLTVTPEEIVLYSEGTIQITTNASAPSFVSQDDYYASVDQTGLVTANKVGETSITVYGDEESKIIPVIVMSQYTLYPDLDGFVGKSESDVITAFGSSYNISNNVWLYQDYTSYATIGFLFTNGKVESAMALVRTSYTSMLVDALTERYSVAGMQNDYFFFLNHDKDILISLVVYNINYLMVIYMSNTSSKNSEELPTFDYEILNKFAH